MYHDAGDWGNAIRFMTKAADGGMIPARYELGCLLMMCTGVEKDHAKGFKFIKLAIDQGLQPDGEALRQLANCYHHGIGTPQNHQLAYRYYKQAAERGGKEEIWMLTVCYEEGIGVAKDLIQAVKYAALAAEKGFVPAYNYLGLAYKNGLGTPKNEEKAFRHFKIAADGGLSNGMYNLGVCYREGVHVQKNHTTAVSYFKRAAEAGYDEAFIELGICYSKGEGFPKDSALAEKYFLEGAQRGVVECQYNLGLMYLRPSAGSAKNPTAATKWLKAAANQGFHEAQYEIGLCYLKGEGVEQDFKAAKKLMESAAGQGNADAKLKLQDWDTATQAGNMFAFKNAKISLDEYRFGKSAIDLLNPDRGAQMVREAADQGLPEALFDLGVYYQTGKGGVSKDLKLGFTYLKKAADQGYAPAQLQIAEAYFEGFGVPKDEKAAVKITQLACENGSLTAKYNMGIYYKYGKGIEKNIKSAIVNFKFCADQTQDKEVSAKSCYHLADIYSNGIGGVSKDHALYLKYIQKSAGEGYMPAQSILGQYLYEDVGDFHQAAKFLALAAAKGDAISQNMLGECYQNGKGVTKNEKTAVEWYKKSAQQGNAEAQFNLGTCYQKGTGVGKDLSIGAKWIIAAADKDLPGALLVAAKLYGRGEGVPRDEKLATKYMDMATAGEYGIEGSASGSQTKPVPAQDSGAQSKPLDMEKSFHVAKDLSRKNEHKKAFELWSTLAAKQHAPLSGESGSLLFSWKGC